MVTYKSDVHPGNTLGLLSVTGQRYAAGMEGPNAGTAANLAEQRTTSADTSGKVAVLQAGSNAASPAHAAESRSGTAKETAH